MIWGSYLHGTTMQTIDRNKVVKALQGLLEIARIAMPDMYFEEDRRVRKAKRLLQKLQKPIHRR